MRPQLYCQASLQSVFQCAQETKQSLCTGSDVIRRGRAYLRDDNADSCEAANGDRVRETGPEDIGAEDECNGSHG